MNKLVDKDKGFNKLLKDFTDLDGSHVTLGIHGKDDEEVDGVTLVDVATFNEFGTRTTPERSFLRRTAEEKKGEWAEMSKGLTRRVLDGKMPARAALELLGEKAVGDVKKTLTELDTPANAPSTIEQKGSSNPLVDTGRLRGAIAHEVRK